MSKPTLLLPEARAAQQAIIELEPGRPDAALELLRQELSRRKPPDRRPDLRPRDVVRLRAYIEQAVVELEHSQQAFALQTLRNGLAAPKQT